MAAAPKWVEVEEEEEEEEEEEVAVEVADRLGGTGTEVRSRAGRAGTKAGTVAWKEPAKGAGIEIRRGAERAGVDRVGPGVITEIRRCIFRKKTKLWLIQTVKISSHLHSSIIIFFLFRIILGKKNLNFLLIYLVGYVTNISKEEEK